MQCIGDNADGSSGGHGGVVTQRFVLSECEESSRVHNDAAKKCFV